MAFHDSEESIQSGRPAYFLQFTRGPKVWRYTNVDQDILLDSQNYQATPFSIPDIQQSGDSKADDLTITIPSNAGICQYLDSRVPSTTITVTLRKAHMVENDLFGTFTAPTLADAPVIWVGEINEIKRTVINSRELVCNTLSLTMARGGLRLSWGRMCPHALYGRGCLVNKDTYAVAAPVVTVVNGITLNVPAAATQSDTWFSGGFLTYESESGVVESLGIESHYGEVLVILGSTYGVATGSNFILYPGCSRSATDCDSKFANILNFGGIYHFSGRSPFDGNPVY